MKTTANLNKSQLSYKKEVLKEAEQMFWSLYLGWIGLATVAIYTIPGF